MPRKKKVSDVPPVSSSSDLGRVPERTDPPTRPHLSILAVNEIGFHRCGFHFQKGRATVIPLESLSEEQVSRLSEAERLGVLAITVTHR